MSNSSPQDAFSTLSYRSASGEKVCFVYIPLFNQVDFIHVMNNNCLVLVCTFHIDRFEKDS